MNIVGDVMVGFVAFSFAYLVRRAARDDMMLVEVIVLVH